MRHWLVAAALLAAVYASSSIARATGLVCLACTVLLWHAEHLGAARKRTTDRDVLPLRVEVWAAPAEPAPPPPALSPELAHLAHLIVRDFVDAWHTRLAPAHAEFPRAVAALLEAALARLQRRVRAVDMTRVVVARVIPALRVHVDLFFRATAHMRLLHTHMADAAHALDVLAELGRVEHFLPPHYGPLHPAVANLSSPQTRETELAALRRVAERVLRGCLAPGDTGALSWVLAREVLGCAVLHPLVDMLTAPDLINTHVAAAAERAVHRVASVARVRATLDEPRGPPPPSAPRRQPHSLTGLLEQIGATDSLIEARRIRSDIVLHIQCTKARGAESRRRASYLARLERALAAVDARIEHLGDARAHAPLADVGAVLQHTRLEDVLGAPTLLSYFMEFMERRQRADVVQFWVMANTFRNPLQDAEDVAVDSLHTLGAAPRAPPTELAELRDALRIIVPVFYARAHLAISPRCVRLAHEFLALADADVSTAHCRVVRQSVLCAQSDAFQQMLTHDWDAFRRSALFLQALDRTPVARGATAPAPLDECSDSSADDAHHEHARQSLLDDDAGVQHILDDHRGGTDSDSDSAAARAQTHGTRLEYLAAYIAKLQQHHELLDTLVRMAELTGSEAHECAVLTASRSAVARDMRQAQWEHESLERRTRQLSHGASLARLHIAATDVLFDADRGRSYVGFHVCADTPSGPYTVVRRYSEFRSLHEALKHRYPQTWTLDALFPGRRLVGLLSASFIESRRRALERYLGALVQVPELEKSTELRVFLACAPATGRPEVATPMFDMVVQELQSAQREPQSHFTEPICDLIIELFDLRQRADWILRHALTLVLQNVLGGTIERWLRDAAAHLVSEPSIRTLAAQLTQALWPNGERMQRAARTPPSDAQRRDTWLRMHHALFALIPAYTENIVGRDHARSGARKLLLIAQNQRLNKHLAYVILDIFVDELFSADN